MKKLYFVFMFAAVVAWNIDRATAEESGTDDVFIDEAAEDDNVPPDEGVAESSDTAPAQDSSAADAKMAEEAPPPEQPVADQAPAPNADTTSTINEAFGAMESTVPLATDDEDNAGAEAVKPSAKPAKAKAQKVVEKKAKKVKASMASSSDGAGAFRLMKKKDCQMRRSPAADSPVLITVKGDRKLWVEDVDGKWVKGFRKTGHGYMPKSCFKSN